MKNRFLILCSFLVITSVCFIHTSLAQKQITIDDIWTHGTYRSKGVPGFRFMNDGLHYTDLVENAILRYDLATGHFKDTILDVNLVRLPEDERQVSDYSFSDDESQVLLKTDMEGIYRYSTKEMNYVYNMSTGNLVRLHDGAKQMHASFSPDGSKVAYVSENDLYYKDLATGTVHRVTQDGKINEIINGSCDWVYEEEFSFTKAFQWSPDSRHIAYYRFDESEVREFSMTYYTGELYPENVSFKYPKVGTENSKVSIHIYDTQSKNKIQVDRDSEPDGYIPRIKWTKDPSKLCVFWMNRHQNHLELLLADAKTGQTKLLLQEDNKYYIDIHDNLTFLSKDECFIWTSEKDGFNHIYLYGLDGTLKRQLTSGQWEITSFYGVDEKNNTVYYQATGRSPLEREVYSIDLKGKNHRLITDKKGFNSAEFSTTFGLFVPVAGFRRSRFLHG